MGSKKIKKTQEYEGEICRMDVFSKMKIKNTAKRRDKKDKVIKETKRRRKSFDGTFL